jgi:hypothetical protein
VTWTAPAVERAESPNLGDERAVLDGWMDFHRDTLLFKCSGLTAEQLKTASAEPSKVTLLGIVRHMTELEQWLGYLFSGEAPTSSYSTEASPEGAWTDIADADAAANLDTYRAVVETTRKAGSQRGLDHVFEEEGETFNLRAMFVHILEEYARHNGHADLIRERIDGETGH